MTNQPIMVVGSNGQLGSDMCIEARTAGHEVFAVDFPRIDITSQQSVEKMINEVRPACIINCAAYTAVDDCETNKATAYALNADGPGYLATAAAAIGARMIHISTDYVFNGNKKGVYVETDTPDPQSIYGASKYEGEQQVAAVCADHQIFRIAWLYGLHGRNFVFNIRAAAEKRAGIDGKMSVVADQFGTPTYTKDVCRQVVRVMRQKELTGIFHATCEGSCCWFDFAKVIVDAAKIPVILSPCTTDEHPRPAPRPKNSHLENERLKAAGVAVMREWREAFDEFLREEAVGEMGRNHV